jgi:hypothetical protein
MGIGRSLSVIPIEERRERKRRGESEKLKKDTIK